MKNVFRGRIARQAGRTCAGVVALTLFGASANAGSSLGALPVSATFVSACTVSAAPINFGTALNPLVSGPTDVNGSITVQCTNGTAANFGVDGGQNSTGAGVRRLKSGTSYLAYQLYQDTAHAAPFGNGSTTSYGGFLTPYTGPGGIPDTHTVYGRIPDLTGAIPGSYADTVMVTVTY